MLFNVFCSRSWRLCILIPITSEKTPGRKLKRLQYCLSTSLLLYVELFCALTTAPSCSIMETSGFERSFQRSRSFLLFGTCSFECMRAECLGFVDTRVASGRVVVVIRDDMETVLVASAILLLWRGLLVSLHVGSRFAGGSITFSGRVWSGA